MTRRAILKAELAYNEHIIIPTAFYQHLKNICPGFHLLVHAGLGNFASQAAITKRVPTFAISWASLVVSSGSTMIKIENNVYISTVLLFRRISPGENTIAQLAAVIFKTQKGG